MRTETNYQFFFNRTINGAVIVNIKGEIIDANNSFCHYFRFIKGEIIGRRLAQLVHFPGLDFEKIDCVETGNKDGSNEQALKLITAANGTSINGVVTVFMLDDNTAAEKKYCIEIQKDIAADGFVPGMNWEYQSLFEYNPEPVFSIGNDGRFTSANLATAKMAGCSQEQLLQMNFADFCDAEDLVCISDHFEEAQNGSTFNFEVGITNLKGEHRYLAVTNMPLVRNNIIEGIYCIAKDITSQRIIEVEKGFVYRLCNIFNSEAGLAECLQLTLHEICHHSGVNAAEAWLTKNPEEQLHLIASYPTSRTLWDAKNLIGEASVTALLDQAVHKKKPAINMIQGGLTMPGMGKYLALIALPLVFKNEVIAVLFFCSNNPQHSSSIFRINENVFVQLAGDLQRKKTEEELNGFFALSSDLLCVAGLDGSFIKINSAFSRMLGYSEQEIMSHDFLYYLHQDDKAFVFDLLENITVQNPVFEFECRFLTKGGLVLFISWTFTSVVNEKLMYGVGRDVTGAKRLQKEIESERKRFSEMFSEAPVMMCILKGRYHVFESANEEYYKFSGRRNIVGKAVRDVFPEAEGQGIFELFDQVYDSGVSYNVNERLVQLDVRGNGQVEDFYLSFMFQPYRNAEGVVEGIFYFGVDVTEQVVARKKVEESKKQYLDLIQNLPAAVYTCDVKGRILIYNKEAVSLWGRVPIHEDDRWCGSWKMYNEDGRFIPNDFSPMARSVKEGKPMKFEELIIERADGTSSHIASFPSPVFDTSGQLTGGVNVMVDITERKQAEVELKRLSLIAKNTINAVLITSVQGQIEWVNDAFTRITGYAFEEAIGKKAAELLHGRNTDQKVVDVINEKFRNNEAFECELLKYTKSGKPVWMEIQAQPLFDEKGKLLYYFILETDITDRKKAFEELVKKENEIRSFARQQNNVLEEERSRLAREIHDEFGQQLTGIKMSLASLRNLCTGNHRAHDLVTDLLADVESSILALRNIATDLRPGILDTLGLIPSIEWLVREFEKKTGIRTQLIKKVNRQVFSRELSTMIFRICQEALTNISKHAEADQVEVNIALKKKELILVITDNGKGINEEKLNAPFSMGIIGMRERANLIGAQLQVTKGMDKGTRIKLTALIND